MLRLDRKQQNSTKQLSFNKKLSFPYGSTGKESACNVGDLGSIPGLGRSPGEGTGYPLQYSGLENSRDCIVHGAAKSQTRLSNFHFTSLRIRMNGPRLLGMETTSKSEKAAEISAFQADKDIDGQIMVLSASTLTAKTFCLPCVQS